MHDGVAAHVASAEAVQEDEMDWPAGHDVVHAVQVVAVEEPVMPVTPSEKVLPEHAVHTVLADAVGAEAR